MPTAPKCDSCEDCKRDLTWKCFSCRNCAQYRTWRRPCWFNLCIKDKIKKRQNKTYGNPFKLTKQEQEICLDRQRRKKGFNMSSHPSGLKSQKELIEEEARHRREAQRIKERAKTEVAHKKDERPRSSQGERGRSRSRDRDSSRSRREEEEKRRESTSSSRSAKRPSTRHGEVTGSKSKEVPEMPKRRRLSETSTEEEGDNPHEDSSLNLLNTSENGERSLDNTEATPEPIQSTSAAAADADAAAEVDAAKRIALESGARAKVSLEKLPDEVIIDDSDDAEEKEKEKEKEKEDEARSKTKKCGACTNRICSRCGGASVNEKVMFNHLGEEISDYDAVTEYMNAKRRFIKDYKRGTSSLRELYKEKVRLFRASQTVEDKEQRREIGKAMFLNRKNLVGAERAIEDYRTECRFVIRELDDNGFPDFSSMLMEDYKFITDHLKWNCVDCQNAHDMTSDSD